ncbi:MAG: hypothetical protein EBR10_02835 [Planctomycetes bacterium]|nr:hypothetical protein [Planctomycetota bacterium]
MKVMLIIMGVAGALLFAKAARLPALEGAQLAPIISWTTFAAVAASAVWLARQKFAAWSAIFGAMAVALNQIAPPDMPANWLPAFHIACGVLCAACVVRNWQ